jgi:hypothetical protein
VICFYLGWSGSTLLITKHIIKVGSKSYTLFESENERQKIEPIPLPRASMNFPDVKTRNEKKFYNWTSEIIPFICFGKQMDRT